MKQEDRLLPTTDRTRLLRGNGYLLLLGGLFAAFAGPVEIYCFYLFSAGGRFYYEGFGFGSFMFGNIASQIIGYCLIAIVLIPLGYGHLRLRRWARTLSVTLLWFWLVTGVPVLILFLLVLFSSKELGPDMAVVVPVALALCYLVLPWLLIRFYQSQNVRATFEANDLNACRTEERPMANLALGALMLFFAVALHMPIFFHSLFPVFGGWLSDLQGIVALDVISNAQRDTLTLWDEIFNEVAASYTAVQTERVLVDAMAARMVLRPESLDVIVAYNLFADIPTDLGGAICGSLGLAPSGNLNPERSYPSMFELVHGSAPDIAGQGIANPLALIWCGAMLLEFLGEEQAARLMMEAIKALTGEGRVVTPELGGAARTVEVGDVIVALMRRQGVGGTVDAQ
jgi:hypothetical protein